MGGNVSTRSINLELGQAATAQVSLNDANVRSLAGVPSGAIILPTNFYGKSSVTYSFPASPLNISTTASLSWSFASAGFKVNFFSGTLIDLPAGAYGAYNSTASGNVTTNLGQWITPGASAVEYEVFATLVSQSGAQNSDGFYGTWLSVGGALWQISPVNYDETVTRTLTVQVREISTATVVGTFTVNLSARWNSFG
jgi:hypothetical protein